jgi:hypothetical protein
LAEFLNRLNPARRLEFCTEFLLANMPLSQCLARRAWFDSIEKPENLHWKTQVRVSDGMATDKRPDMVLYDNERPIMVVECKVGAGFTGGEERDLHGRRYWIGQLERYDRWLNGLGAPQTALVLLTHLSEAPENFSKGNGFHTPVRAVQRWSALYKLLTERNGSTRWAQGEGLEIYVADFCALLMEHELMYEDPSMSDFAAARLFATRGAQTRIFECMHEARKQIRPLLDRYGKMPKSGAVFEPDGEDGLIIDYVEPANGPSIVWGFWFGMPGSKVWGQALEPPLAQHEGAIVYVEFEKVVRRPSGGNFQEWRFPAFVGAGPSDVLKIQPFSSFFEAEDARNAIVTWMKAAVIEALEIAREAHPK